jgi:ABC-type Zn uptake system ZnuABC Zn-binding protein ZnuA
MGDLAKLCVEKRVRLIAVEPQYSTNLARTLRGVLKEKGVPDPVLVEIDPLETAERDEVDAGWYERKMRQNLDALAEALR